MSERAMGAPAGPGQDEFGWFVGLDWGTATHVVDIGDAAGATLATCRVEHTGTGLHRFVERLTTLSGGHLDRVAVAIERPRGAEVETLLEHGAAVFTLNPKQLDRFRDRFSVAGAKDDALDALVLRSALRTDRARFRRLAPEDPRIIQVRELTRAEDELAQEFNGLTNRLREQVHRIAPDWLTMSANADDPWFWMLLEQAKTPAQGARLRRTTIESLLRTYRIRRVSVDDVLTVLKAPPVFVAPGTVDATARHIALLLRRVRLVHVQRQECAHELEALLDALTGGDDADPTSPPPPSNAPSDVAIMRSAPGAGTRVVSLLIADAMALVTSRDYLALRATSGVAPVRRQTGKNARGTVGMRYACNARLRQALYFWASTSTRFDAAAKRYYAALRSRGHTHGRALRSVADRWLRILMAMLQTRTLYDPSRFATAVDDVAPSTPVAG